VLLEAAVTARVCVSLLAPELMPERETMMVVLPVAGLTSMSGSGSRVGRSLTEFTVRLNELLAVNEPSLTTRVIRVLPNWLRVGTRVTVRLLPLPSINMLVLATSAVFVELAVTSRRKAGVSASPIVKGIVIGVSSFVI